MKKLFTILTLAAALTISAQAQVADYLIRPFLSSTNLGLTNGTFSTVGFTVGASTTYTATPSNAGSFTNTIMDLRLYSQVGIQIATTFATNFYLGTSTVDVSTNVFKFCTSVDKTNWNTGDLFTLTLIGSGTATRTINSNIVLNAVRYIAPYSVMNGSTNSAMTFLGVYALKPIRAQGYSAP